MKRFKMEIQTVIVVFMLVALLTSVSFAEQFKEYNYPNKGFSVKFPVSWTVKNTPRGCMGKTDDYMARAQISDHGNLKVELDVFFDAYRTELKKRFSSEYKELKVGETKVDGHMAKVLGFSTVESGVYIEGRHYVISVDGNYYIILFLSNKTSAKKAAPRFVRILKSIKFTK